ncbi:MULTISPECIES: zeta toxin family protein [Caldisericum]|jgi:fused signal recognition particle receptor|uniref:Signal recognition particle-docking protein FtsY n=1 Tax=Caldisericum exile TaxID=693075 RepID=A0A2J6WE34_9BACT|nr:MAG: signal recognition particle-docking protein FtsY [Caldisericum exile]PMP84171.1 MAG: signal recognition particle-docking protein FtsY [Caldisericum exile]
MNIFEKLKNLFSKKDLATEEIEEFLISKNFGIKFTEEFIEKLKESKIDYLELFEKLIRETFNSVDTKVNTDGPKPVIFVFAGSNGSGKTTSIAKIANYHKKRGFKNILLIAGDTFRSGATEQLSIWAERIDVDIVKGQSGQDPASVVFDGLSKEGIYDLILVDTSGRVETNENLLRELTKIEKVILNKKGHINEVFLVLDSLTGLNAFNQMEAFVKAINVTGIILTKFDSNSAPGVVVPIVQTYKIPVKFIGTGEGIEDLEEFSVDTYIHKLTGGTK